MTFSSEIKELNNQYFDWLRDNTILREINDDWTEITTPFLDRHNDCMQIYVRPERGNVHLTDDGYIIDDLQMSGCEIDSPKRQIVLKEMLNGFGIKFVDGRLEAIGTKREFPQLKHSLIQAMLAVDDMFYLSSPHVASLFSEDAESWLNSVGVRFAPNVNLKGKSGFSYHIFAVIPRSSHAPERIVQPINCPDKKSVQRLIFEWDDTKETRKSDSVIYPLLNDSEITLKPAILSAFEQYGIQPIPWSQRKEYEKLLAS
jgi:hypothetical protein